MGQPRARIDWRASDAEFATLGRMVELFVAEARRLGHQPPEVAPWLAGGVEAWRGSVHDMAHPIGTTRMASDPARGVVDADCQVHGVAGLSVAGSSTFATSGYMNPTLTIVALALRLADHLAAGLAADRPPVITADPRPSSARLRVGLVGFGDRMRRFHLPVLQGLADQFEVVGFTARSEATRRRAAGATGLADYATAADLVADAAPDFMVAAVSPDAVDAALPGILGLGVPVLLETPLCWNLASGRSAVAQIESSGLLVGVAEQTPHLPLEQLKRRVIELGLIGQVESAQNDGAVFDYHGLAALRAYLDGGRRPALVRATEVAGERGPVLDATVTCTDGTTLLHRYEDGVDGRLLATTSSGGFRDDVVVVAEGGERREVRVERIEADGTDLRSLVARLPQAEVWWHNPFAGHGFTDEQVAVAAVLVDFAGAVRTGGDPAYLAADSLLDMELLTAMRYSAADGGRTITLPVSALDRVRSKLAPRLKRR
jgi:predicted dehydrogenase